MKAVHPFWLKTLWYIVVFDGVEDYLSDYPEEDDVVHLSRELITLKLVFTERITILLTMNYVNVLAKFRGSCDFRDICAFLSGVTTNGRSMYPLPRVYKEEHSGSHHLALPKSVKKNNHQHFLTHHVLVMDVPEGLFFRTTNVGVGIQIPIVLRTAKFSMVKVKKSLSFRPTGSEIIFFFGWSLSRRRIIVSPRLSTPRATWKRLLDDLETPRTSASRTRVRPEHQLWWNSDQR